MFTVLICDDEIRICKLIKNLIDWDQLSLRLIKFVHSGPEALSAIISEKPDIVITDIRMPDFDGLELIRKTRELNIHAHFIIVSGYKHFEYAHSALKYEVFDYLLKPINEVDLNSALRSITKKISSDLTSQSQDIEMQNRIVSLQSNLYLKLLDDCIINNVSVSISDAKEKYGIEMNYSILNALILKFNSAMSMNQTNQSVEVAIEKTLNFVLSRAKNGNLLLYAFKNDNNIVILCGYEKANRKELNDLYENIYFKAVEYTSAFKNIFVTLAVGQEDMTFVHQPIQTAYLALYERALH